MDVLKSVGYILASVLVLSGIVGVGLLVAVIVAVFGTVIAGVGVVVFVAYCLKEYFKR